MENPPFPSAQQKLSLPPIIKSMKQITHQTQASTGVTQHGTTFTLSTVGNSTLDFLFCFAFLRVCFSNWKEKTEENSKSKVKATLECNVITQKSRSSKMVQVCNVSENYKPLQISNKITSCVIRVKKSSNNINGTMQHIRSLKKICKLSLKLLHLSLEYRNTNSLTRQVFTVHMNISCLHVSA